MSAFQATIATQLDNFFMDVPKSNFKSHQSIQIYPKDNLGGAGQVSLNQTWTIVDGMGGIVPIPDGYVNIYAGIDSSNHLCLDVPNSDTTSGTLIQLYPANGPGGSKNQQWKIIPAGNNFVYIASALNEKDQLVLDVRGGVGAPHALIQIYERGNRQSNQLWSIIPFTPLD